jgi:hypothetical protein
MGLKEVKKELNTLDKTEIIKLISEMYKNIPSVKTYLDVFANGEIKQLADKYKAQIERFVFPLNSSGALRQNEAIKLIREIRKLKITQLNVELELHYVDCCLEVIEDFGFWNENYYIAIERMFYSATKGITELGMDRNYKKQLDSIYNRASEFGLELNYELK